MIRNMRDAIADFRREIEWFTEELRAAETKGLQKLADVLRLWIAQRNQIIADYEAANR